MKHEFVEFIPDRLENDVLYVSLKFGTASHRCCCGCGSEVVTPLTPTDWKLIYDGETVSLYPSVGNWGLPCRSHYWIENGQVEWAEPWPDEKIEENRNLDRRRKLAHYGRQKASVSSDCATAPKSTSPVSKKKKSRPSPL